MTIYAQTVLSSLSIQRLCSVFFISADFLLTWDFLVSTEDDHTDFHIHSIYQRPRDWAGKPEAALWLFSWLMHCLSSWDKARRKLVLSLTLISLALVFSGSMRVASLTNFYTWAWSWANIMWPWVRECSLVSAANGLYVVMNLSSCLDWGYLSEKWNYQLERLHADMQNQWTFCKKQKGLLINWDCWYWREQKCLWETCWG